MYATRYADPNCKFCKDHPGRIKTGPGIRDWAICPCVQLGQRKDAAEKTIQKVFPRRAQRMTLSSFETGDFPQNQEALQVARNFVNNWLRAKEHGWVLGFYGMPRSGKTHLAIAIAQACTKRYNIRPQLLNLPTALRTERERFNNPDLPSPLLQAQKADLLILDDLGAEYERQGDNPSRVSWLTEQLYSLLDERFMNNRPLLYTSNLTPADMTARYDNEAWRRVWARLEAAQVAPPLEILKVDGVEIADAEAERLLFAPSESGSVS